MGVGIIPVGRTDAEVDAELDALPSRFGRSDDVSRTVKNLGGVHGARLTFVTQFATGHGWSLGTDWADSTSAPLFGSNCISMTSSANTARNADSPAATNLVLDITNRPVVLWLRQTGTVSNIRVFLGNSDFTSYVRVDPNVTATRTGWFAVELWANGPDVAETFGTPTLNSIARIRIQARSATGGTLQVGGIATRETHPWYPNGVMAFCFDDGFVTDWSVARPKLAEYGWSASAHVNMQAIDSGSDYLTTDMLQALVDIYGWEVGAQSSTTANDTSWAAWTSEQVATEVATMRTWERTLGLNQRIFAPPTGALNQTMLSVFKADYDGVRITGSGVWPRQSYPALDRWRVRSSSFTTSITTADITDAIDAVVETGGLYVVTLHSLLSGRETQFGAIVDHAASTGIEVLPLSEAILARRTSVRAA